MRPIPFPQQNMVLAEHQPQYESMPCHWDRNTGACIGCFELTDAERAAIASGDPLWLWQYTFGRPFQPVSLTTDNPWPQDTPSAPVPEDVAARCRDSTNAELLECALQVYARACAYSTKDQHDAAMAYKAELLRRLSVPNYVVAGRLLESLAGYFQDGSAETISIHPDDATRTWHVKVGGRDMGWGAPISSALFSALNTKGEIES